MTKAQSKGSQYNVSEINRAIEILGTASTLARELKITPISVYKWRDLKAVPSPENCLKIEKVTRGKVLAKDIRPDLDWERILEGLRNII
ncbi:MAG: helix-turn-helix domain-containing protein [Candidatus Paracaedibacteraceae bacterium]|nr:helix-turn-helix domain-containing protein [Candidatus Paracaedibacteraceae bacterium]